MKTVLRWASALCMLSVSTIASAASLPTGFAVGYNEAWIGNYYNWLASNQFFPPPNSIQPDGFNHRLVKNMFSGMEQGKATIVRIWLFPLLQGICIQQVSCDTSHPALTSEFLGNLATVFSLARKYKLQLYITALNANDANFVAANPNLYPAVLTYYRNLFSNNGGATAAYENSVLGPILNLMSQNQDVIYAFDLIDEIEAAITAGYFSNWITGAQAWIRNMAAFVKSYHPCNPTPSCMAIHHWLPVTSSAGGGFAVQEVTFGLFSELGLNFYDVHIYSDSGSYSGRAALCSKTQLDKLQIVLGEYGQKSSTVSDTLQNTATTNFLKRAKSSCFSSTLAWKYEAVTTTAPWLSYLYINNGVLLAPPCPTLSQQVPGPACARPAYNIIQNFVP
jgi:hypothetical protein